MAKKMYPLDKFTNKELAMTTLFGMPGAERLATDPAEIWESEIEVFALPENPDVLEWQVEEFSVHEPQHHLRVARVTPRSLIGFVKERVDDYGELTFFDDDWFDPLDEELLAKAAELLELVASKTKFVMAKDLIATHTISLDDNGEPLFDGEPMYVRAEH